MLWVETEANLADHPSRFNPLPPPRPCPLWLQRLGVAAPKPQVGLEIAAGAAGLSQGLREHGCRMLHPIDVLKTFAGFRSWFARAIASKRFSWVWLSLPGGKPTIWARMLSLVELAIEAGVFVFLVHPRESPLWKLHKSVVALNHDSMHSFCIDSFRIVTSTPWFNAVAQLCPGLDGPTIFERNDGATEDFNVYSISRAHGSPSGTLVENYDGMLAIIRGFAATRKQMLVL
ncbi:hypothetical protein AK812_SmicGene38579 [Symbiodinium microadriaticum]|uniref:Uncharacterized protein n=1 Tax=Symbiodinium microadriaticum TaxID=2951 RepID=A0A1Q9CDE2_SYMMI|nr:hypothetical protein AK812_SmicGene38579 [Symbiodinium microadriaticum]